MEKIKTVGNWNLWIAAGIDGGSFEIWHLHDVPYSYSFVKCHGKFPFKLSPKRKWLIIPQDGIHAACEKAIARLIELNELDKATVEAIELSKELALEAVGEIE